MAVIKSHSAIMKTFVFWGFAVWMVCAVFGEEEFLPGLEPEEIMKVKVQPEDLSDKGMAETIIEAGGKGNFQLDMKMDALQMALNYNPKLHTGFAGAAIIDKYYRWPKKNHPLQNREIHQENQSHLFGNERMDGPNLHRLQASVEWSCQ